ncbi:unnamed protein product [Fraxinus pennsylvanica]|uniref:Uncharacterized protein n=1 Tax=Fraxinus pennsylvanica TaxID=56036 RepID=A0AAD2DSJ8_9LAMI|nr:unnamed protein product [Fraxinus pennsylvanica]
MTSRVRWSSMPRVPRLQDEEDNDWIENGYEDSDGSLSADDNDGLDCRKRGPNHGSNICADETGRIPLTVGDNRFITISASCSISTNLKAYLGGPYPTFSFVSVDTKKVLLGKIPDESLDLDNHIRSVYQYWLKAKNAGYSISDRWTIGHLIETLTPCDKRIEKLIQENMLSQILESEPKEPDFEGFCNANVHNWETMIGDVITHSRSESTGTLDNEVGQPIVANANEDEK